MLNHGVGIVLSSCSARRTLLIIITYSKGRSGREAFSIHPVIHPWMASYREENPGRSK
jgi:hypothetical protein